MDNYVKHNQRLQEGVAASHLFTAPETDVKGHHYATHQASVPSSLDVYQKVVKRRIFPESVVDCQPLGSVNNFNCKKVWLLKDCDGSCRTEVLLCETYTLMNGLPVNQQQVPCTQFKNFFVNLSKVQIKQLNDKTEKDTSVKKTNNDFWNGNEVEFENGNEDFVKSITSAITGAETQSKSTTNKQHAGKSKYSAFLEQLYKAF